MDASSSQLRRFSLTGGLIAASALVYSGYHVIIAFDRNDTNHLETPLLLALERQLKDGSSTLFGPFSARDPLVLIHAPLYYRIAGVGARGLARSARTTNSRA